MDAPTVKRSKTALPGRRGNVVHMNPHDLTVIDDKNHPLYDPRVELPLDPGFAANIDKEGVRVPVLVAKLDYMGAIKNIIIVGKQRHRAIQQANARRLRWNEPLLTIPAIAVKGDTCALFSLMILENECRRDDTPLEKAAKVKRFIILYVENEVGEPKPDCLDCAELIPAVKQAKEQAAITFGTTMKTIEARMKLLATAPAVQKAVEAGNLGWWAASEFAGMPPEAQEQAVKELIAEGGANGGKPQVEDAKRKVGKGEAKHREEVAKALARLKAAALAYGKANSNPNKLELVNAAENYYWLMKS